MPSARRSAAGPSTKPLIGVSPSACAASLKAALSASVAPAAASALRGPPAARSRPRSARPWPRRPAAWRRGRSCGSRSRRPCRRSRSPPACGWRAAAGRCWRPCSSPRRRLLVVRTSGAAEVALVAARRRRPRRLRASRRSCRGRSRLASACFFSWCGGTSPGMPVASRLSIASCRLLAEFGRRRPRRTSRRASIRAAPRRAAASASSSPRSLTMSISTCRSRAPGWRSAVASSSSIAGRFEDLFGLRVDFAAGLFDQAADVDVDVGEAAVGRVRDDRVVGVVVGEVFAVGGVDRFLEGLFALRRRRGSPRPRRRVVPSPVSIL